MQYTILFANLMSLLVSFAVADYGNDMERLDDIAVADDAPFGWNSFVYGLPLGFLEDTPVPTRAILGMSAAVFRAFGTMRLFRRDSCPDHRSTKGQVCGSVPNRPVVDFDSRAA
ncbi:MAG: hypothetical protein JO034_00630 [Singulisphaera sp.]|nr:hypothetical protein [Singulisphaera sp.]